MFSRYTITGLLEDEHIITHHSVVVNFQGLGNLGNLGGNKEIQPMLQVY